MGVHDGPEYAILASNSWMHTPAGYTIVENQVIPVDWFSIIFNPSFPYRLVHMVLAAFLSTALLVAASAAWHLTNGNTLPAVKKMLTMAVGMIVITAPLQIIAGDLHGLNTLEYQPAKVAAMEGHWENDPGEHGVPLLLVGWPDDELEKTHFKIGIPHLGSLILTHSWGGSIPALKDFPTDERPDSTIVFWTFRIMVGLGMLMLLLGNIGAWKLWRGRLFQSTGYLRFALCMGPSGLIALLAGWYTTEIGRQPWVVHGLLRTDQAASTHGIPELSFSLTLFVLTYLVVFGAGVKYMLRLIGKGPGQPVQTKPISID